MQPDFLQELQHQIGDRYTIDREIARGGMATVYLAHDVRHDRDVALKVMHREVALALGRERFLREIKLTARLSHPNILTVHDSGEAGDCVWYVMPYVEGKTLRDLILEKKQLDVDDAVRYMREAADAVGYAHSLGVIHRDIKPENILLSRGHAVVADFGIARAIESARDEHLTATGTALGTTAYMSPEQALGEEVNAASDVWALGCVLYELIGGQAPFGTGGREVVTRAITGKPKPLREIRPDVTPAIEAVVMKAIARNSEDRFGNASEFAAALDRPGHLPAAQQSRRGAYIAFAVIALAALTIFAATRRKSVEPVESSAKSKSPDASQAAALVDQGRAQQVRRSNAGSTNAIRLYMQAIAQDSTYVPAWAELARATNFAYGRAFTIPGMSRDSLLSLSVTASERVVALEPAKASSWLVKARAARLVDPVDLKPAMFALEKAFALDSSNSDIWWELGNIKMDLLDNDGSQKAYIRSAELKPTDVQTLSFLALDNLWSGNYAKGMKWADSAIALDPTYRLAREAKAQIMIEMGDAVGAERQFEVSLRSESGNERVPTLGLLALAYAVAGDSSKAKELVGEALPMIDMKNPPRHDAVWVAAAMAAYGDTASAVRLLEAYHPREDLHFQMHLKWDPRLKWVRGNWGRKLLLN